MSREQWEKGGRAFPCDSSFDDFKGVDDFKGGMWLRDYFAAQALVGLLTDRVLDVALRLADDYVATVAANAYRFADAMIAAREKETP